MTYWSRDGIVDCSPAVTVLRFSAGAQSTCLLHMYTREELPRPDVFLVTAADPGMEDSRSVEHRERMFTLARAAGIECRLCPGGNLYEDLVNGVCTDNPRYYADMRRERPDDFAKVRRVDAAIRDLSRIGASAPVYLHKRCVPVDALADEGDEDSEDDDLGCDSGHCFY